MMNIWIKRIYKECLVCLIILLLTFGLCGCGKSRNNESYNANASTYNTQNVEIKGAKKGLYSFKTIHVGDNTVLYGVNTHSVTGDNIAHFYYINTNGSVEYHYNLDLGAGSVKDVTLDEEGNIYVACLMVEKENKATDIEEIEESDDEIKQVYPIEKPQTNALYPSDKLGYSLFAKRYEENRNKKDIVNSPEKDSESSDNEKDRVDENEIVYEEDNAEDKLEKYVEDNAEGNSEGNSEDDATDMDTGDYSEEELLVNEESYTDETGENSDIFIEEGQIPEDNETENYEYSEALEGAKEDTISIEINPEENEEDYSEYYGGDYYYDESGETENGNIEVKILKISRQGELKYEKDIFEDGEVFKNFGESAYLLKNIVSYQNNIYLLFEDGIVCYDNESDYSCLVTKDNTDEKILSAESLIRGNSGDIYCLYMDNNTYEYFVTKVDLNKGTCDDKDMKVFGEKYSCRVLPGVHKELSYYKNGYIYDFDYGDTDKVLSVDFGASDTATDYVSAIAKSDDLHFYAIYRNLSDDEYQIGFFTKSDNNKIQKKELTLATVQNNISLKKAIADFNKTNPEYRIRLLDYSTMYGNGSDFESENTVLEKLNTDIIAGNMPDLIMLDNSMPIQTYINKGLLEDMYPMFEEDSSIDLDNYNKHVFDVYSNDNHLYRIPVNFTIQTVIVKESIAGERNGWTIDEALEVYNNSKALTMFYGFDRSRALDVAMNLSGSEYIDVESGLCNFDTESFKQLLTFVKSFQEKFDWNSSINVIIENNWDSVFRDEYVLCDYVEINNLFDYQKTVKGYFGTDVNCIGFPSASGKGSTFDTTMMMGISGISDYKDGAWEFVKYLLSDSMQNSIVSSGTSFPVSNTAMNTIYDNIKINPLMDFYIYEGVKYPFPVEYYLGGESYPVPAMTDEEVNKFIEMMNGVESCKEVNSKVMTIINEEVTDYFKDKSTVDEVVNRIQSRAQIYLYESQ